MRPWAWMAFLLGILLLVPPSPALGQKKSRKKPGLFDREASAQDYVALGKMKEVVGQLLSVGAAGQMTVKVEYPILVPKSMTTRTSSSSAKRRGNSNPAVLAQKQLQAQLHLQQQALKGLHHVLTIRNPLLQRQQLDKLLADLQAQQAHLANQQTKLFAGSAGAASGGSSTRTSLKVVTASVQFQLPLGEKIQVARAVAEPRFDSDGKVIPYTAAELRKKHDPSMPGFRADRADLAPVQLVRIYVGASKAVQKGKVLPKKEELDEEEIMDAPDQENRPQVRMVLILSEMETAAAAKATKKNKQIQ